MQIGGATVPHSAYPPADTLEETKSFEQVCMG